MRPEADTHFHVQVPLTNSARLVAVGDLQLGDSPTTVGYGFYSRYRGNSISSLFASVQSELRGADIVFGNLETILLPPPKGSVQRSELQLRGDRRFATDLRNVGFTILNVANNHAVQHGEDVFHASVKVLRDAGLACCGLRGTAPWSSEPILIPANGLTVGFLGYSYRPRQYGGGEPPYAEARIDDICADVRRLRERATVVVVSLHWGEEFVPMPSSSEVAIGRAIIESGAAVILGHHPHVTRPAERYRNGLIVHSLGNFMGDMVWYQPFRRGAVLRCTLTADGAANASMTPTRLDDDYVPHLTAEAAETPLEDGTMQGLNALDYSRAIHQSMRRQRLAAYRAAIQNMPKIPRPILAQMVRQTLRNKLNSVLARFGRRED